MHRAAPLRGLWWRIPAALVALLWLAPACLLGSAVACAVASLVWVILTVVLAMRRLALFLGDL
jgi:uncharacterized integral membrane protein